MPNVEKKELRKLMRQKLLEMTDMQMNAESGRCTKMILSMEEFKKAAAVLSYMPMSRELDVLPLSECIMPNEKIFALPRSIPNSSQMDFFEIDCNKKLCEQLENGMHGIMEPAHGLKEFFPSENVLCKSKIDSLKKGGIFVIVPGVAFDEGFHRLGHGCGYYDAYLERLVKAAGQLNVKVFTCGTCFSCQKVPFVPHEVHDIEMDAIACGDGTLIRKN